MKTIHPAPLPRSSSLRLYNLIFPLFFFFVVPITWIWPLFIFGNLAIDCAVLCFCLKLFNPRNWKQGFKKTWWKVWLLGYLGDVLGCVILFAIGFIPYSETLYPIEMAVYYNPWSHPVGLLLVCLTIILAGFALYFLDSRLALRKSGLSVKGRRKAALIISIATAPYVLLIPTSLFF